MSDKEVSSRKASSFYERVVQNTSPPAGLGGITHKVEPEIGVKPQGNPRLGSIGLALRILAGREVGSSTFMMGRGTEALEAVVDGKVKFGDEELAVYRKMSNNPDVEIDELRTMLILSIREKFYLSFDNMELIIKNREGKYQKEMLEALTSAKEMAENKS